MALALQLGYDVSADHARKTIEYRDPHRRLFVAVVPGVGVIGWVGVSARETLTSSWHAQIEGLVVEDEYRSNQIGVALLHRAESWGRDAGCTEVRVHSNVTRERARAFYERNGYGVLKTQRIFTKSI